MAARKSKPLVEALRIDTRVMREQLHQHAAFRARLRDRPLYQFFADAAAAAMRCDANILDQAARSALRREARHDAKLQAADDGPLAVNGDDELQIGITINPLE